MSLTKRKTHNDKDEEALLKSGDTQSDKSNIKGDEVNIAVLLILYTLQGIPLGLAAAVPMLLQARGSTYFEQAQFSFVNWPFSIKLLWAPLVDALFWPKYGRRKSWLVPVQYLIAIVMMCISGSVMDWLGTSEKGPKMSKLIISFMFLNFLAATQDIAVDGWALTMLKRCNVGHVSTCNTMGQTAGFFLGYVLFLAFESPQFCNKYFSFIAGRKEDEGLVTLSSFLMFWGLIFLTVTTLIALFKHENIESTNAESQPRGTKDIVKAYKQLYSILTLRPVRTLAVVLFTCKMGFSASETLSGFKLIEAGIPREDLALLTAPLIPVQIVMPMVLAKYTTGPYPLALWLKAYPSRLIVGVLAAGWVALTPMIIGDQPPSYSYFGVLTCIYIFQQACLYCMFISVMAFFAKVSDPVVGGTYMTLLNTVSNLGTNWPSTVALWAVDHLTFKQCSAPDMNDNTCSSPGETELCNLNGGVCETVVDGFYIEIMICFLVGAFWLRWGSALIRRLQGLPASAWKISHSTWD